MHFTSPIHVALFILPLIKAKKYRYLFFKHHSVPFIRIIQSITVWNHSKRSNLAEVIVGLMNKWIQKRRTRSIPIKVSVYMCLLTVRKLEIICEKGNVVLSKRKTKRNGMTALLLKSFASSIVKCLKITSNCNRIGIRKANYHITRRNFNIACSVSFIYLLRKLNGTTNIFTNVKNV